MRRIVLGLGIVLLVLVGAAAAFVVTREEGDVSNPDVEFRDEPAATPEPEQEPAEPGKKTDPVDRFIWPHYGYTRDRRRYLPLKQPPRPPFKEIWQYQGNVLLEFPPVIGGKRLYLLNDSGMLFAIDKHTGKALLEAQARRPRRRLARLRRRRSSTSCCSQRTRNGCGARAGPRRRARRQDGQDPLEPPSSPAAASPRRWSPTTGSTSARRTARSTRWARGDGSVRWRFRAGGAVKGGLALADGRLYFGDYGGRVYAIRQDSGRQAWRASTQRRPLRPRRGQLLLDARGRLRARLHRQHRRAGLLVLGRQREARLEQEHRRLRLRLARRGAGAGRAAARLRGLLQRPLLRARRAQRRGALVARRQRQDLRRRQRDRRHRLLRRPRQQAHDRARRAHRPQGLRARARLLQPGRLRRRDDLPDRLPRDVRAAAAVDRGGAGAREGRAPRRRASATTARSAARARARRTAAGPPPSRAPTSAA